MSGALIPKGGYYSAGPTLVDMGLIANGGGRSWTTGVTATTGGQIGALRLRAQLNFIDAVQGAGSGVMLPNLTGGQFIYIFNRSASSITVWVAVNTSDTIIGVGTSETLPAGTTRTYVSVADGWIEWIASSASALPIIATGSTTARTVQDRFADAINVKDFGARGDGSTDDAAAINSALTYLRSLSAPAGHLAYKLVFPFGRYVVRSTLNFTGLASFGVIDGQGSEIWGQIAGAPVIDALGSRFLNIKDLSVYGDPTTTPSIGIQIGRIVPTTSGSADDHSWSNVQIWGNFTFACLYNFAAETTRFITCGFRNNATGAGRFCVVQDGINHWHATSAFVTVTAPVDTGQSFNENAFSSCIFQGSGSNGVVWIAATARHLYDRCYLSCSAAGAPAFVSYGLANGITSSMLDVDCHCENSGVAFLMTAAAGVTYNLINGFSFEDNACFSMPSILAVDNTSALTSVELRNASFRILRGGGSSATLFGVPSRWIVEAKYAGLDTGMWQAPQVWVGQIEDLNNPAASRLVTNLLTVTGGGTSQTISANGQTIAVPIGTNVTTLGTSTGANMTGMILALGSNYGVSFMVINLTAYTLTFAAAGTSNVVGGPTIAAFSSKQFVFGSNNQWWPT